KRHIGMGYPRLLHATGDVPQSDGPVVASGEQRLAIWQEPDEGDPVAVFPANGSHASESIVGKWIAVSVVAGFFRWLVGSDDRGQEQQGQGRADHGAFVLWAESSFPGRDWKRGG